MPKRFYILVLAGLTALAIRATSRLNKNLRHKRKTDVRLLLRILPRQGRKGLWASSQRIVHSTHKPHHARQKHGGKYPAAEVANVLKSGVHGSQDMPTWGPVFGSMNKANPTAEETKRINTLVEFIRVSQVK